MSRPIVGTGYTSVWTDERINAAVEALRSSRTIAEAAAKVGVTAASLQSAFTQRKAQVGGSAAAFLNRSESPKGSQRVSRAEELPRETKPAVTERVYAGAATVAEPGTVMGKVRRAVARIGGTEPGRYRVGHFTDVHFGSSHCDTKALLDYFALAKSRGVTAFLCTGDVLDGVSEKLLMEQRAVGFERQADEAVETLVAAKLGSLPIVAITGNHDGYFNDTAGVDAGRALAERMQGAGVHWLCVGSCLGRAIVHGARVELYHPHGGGATRNAVRRVLNAKAERYTDEDRPHLLVGGHFHKTATVHAYPENVFCVGGGTFQRRESDFGVRMIHPWDIGGGIISWTVREDGSVGEFAHEFFDVRPEARGWAA